ncbi:predicted protein [Uncinocarpus reesii 1704]|uniref:Uncharacterized protein n=1 Tax=Uncinocarpus reesii (strain UAMH 1704) TaxID=336963 RepID=C4JEU9_UNCRE|nr:uncharacterized protein UREG_02259 [Uncinocarpus reesii 1704]EEP77410.1 predicted protein [Uncinocarpus reesii 1704]
MSSGQTDASPTVQSARGRGWFQAKGEGAFISFEQRWQPGTCWQLLDSGDRPRLRPCIPSLAAVVQKCDEVITEADPLASGTVTKIPSIPYIRP